MRQISFTNKFGGINVYIDRESLEIILPKSKDRLAIQFKEHHFYKSKPTRLYSVTYLERDVDEDGKEIFYTNQTEYFAEDDVETAVKALEHRLNSNEPYRAACLGKSLDELCEKEAAA